MAIDINVGKEDIETLFVRVNLTGLTPGERYDVMRLQLRNRGKNDAGNRVYERDLPDRRAFWSAVAHRVGWEAPAASCSFRDFDCPRRPTKFFIVKSDLVGPYEYDFSNGNYPISRGVLDSEVVHWNGDLQDILGEKIDEGHVVVRSINELAHYVEACVVDMDGPRYTARVNEFPVMGSQYPVIVSDSREARRGTVTLMTRHLGQYNRLRRLVYPESGRIRPFLMHSGGDSTMLLDDMKCIALDVEVEQATQRNPDLRYIHIDYVEIDNSAPLLRRSGDNDNMTDPPEAHFNISDTTPAVGQWITLTDTSTGQGDDWDWSIERGNETDNKTGEFSGAGPHKIRFGGRGRKTIKLRFGGSGEGYHTRTRYVDVH